MTAGGRPQVDAPRVEDGYGGSAPEAPQKVKLPPLEEPSPQTLSRGYLWQAVDLPGPLNAVIGAVVSTGPMPRWMGLEPAPKGRPDPEPLNFSWTQSNPIDFAQHSQRLEGLLRDPAAVETGKRRIRGGSNANYLVTLNNGASAVWTPTRGEKAHQDRPNIPTGTSAQREEAAYLVDKFMGHFARVPPAVSSGLEGRPGALKLLVSQGLAADRRPDGLPDEDYRRIALFDHVIGNLDRHVNNYLLDESSKPIPIDHGLAFPTKNGPQGTANFRFEKVFQLNQKEREALTSLVKQRPQVEKTLEGLLEKPAIEAMYERVDQMLTLGWVSHQWRG